MTDNQVDPGASGSAVLRRDVLSAFCANLIGIGLARFAYTPLLPAIIGAHWFEPAQAAYLGAVNLAGYLGGALTGRPLAARFSTVSMLRMMMVLATVAFFACAEPLGLAWFMAWRFAAGLAGGALMVLAAPAVLSHVSVGRRGLAGGLIFMGVGTGVVASGTLVPLLLERGVGQSWLGLGILSLVLTGLAWGGWPADVTGGPVALGRSPGLRPLRAVYAEYALNAAGWVPHMIFLVDFVARGLGQGVRAGSHYWLLFGVGAAAGPILAGHFADRIGFRTALRLGFLMETAAVAIPGFCSGSVVLAFSSLVVGAFVTGTVPLVLGRIHELLPHHPAWQKAAWGRATIAFALCQAGAGYGLSFLFAATGGNYRLLFLMGALAMIMALAVDLKAGGASRAAVGQSLNS